MTLKQLQACYWAARLGSFSIAAKRLNITQSTLSKRILELEAELGVCLFDRSGKRALPTEAGARLADMALGVLDGVHEISSIAKVPDTLRGICRFGVSEFVALTWLPALLIHLQEAHPELQLQPHVDLAGVLEQLVLRGELDFAVAPGQGYRHNLQHDLLKHVEFGWVAAPSRYPSDHVLTPAYLNQATVITLTEESGMTQTFNSWCTVQGIRIGKRIVCNNLTMIVGLAIAGLGFGFLPGTLTESCLRQGLLKPLQSTLPLPALSYHFIRRTDDRRALVQRMHQYVNALADFSSPILAWQKPAIHKWNE